jgi:threonine synthase
MVVGSASFLQSLQCTACASSFEANAIHGVCPRCQKVLFARYDLAALEKAISPNDFSGRRWDMWRYHELLPVWHDANIVTLGEGMTPLLRVSERVSARLRGRSAQHQGRGEESNGELQGPRHGRRHLEGEGAGDC